MHTCNFRTRNKIIENIKKAKTEQELRKIIENEIINLFSIILKIY